MKTTLSTGLRLAAWSTAGLLVMGTAAGTADAVTSHHSGHGQGDPQGGPGGGQGGQPGGPGGGPAGPAHVMPGLVHSIATIKAKKKYETIKQQVGTINEVNSEAIVVTSSDEYAATYSLASNTKITKDCKTIKAGKLSEGDTVTITAKKSGSHFKALSISEGTGKAPKKPSDS